jgi:hypothetical protein
MRVGGCCSLAVLYVFSADHNPIRGAVAICRYAEGRDPGHVSFAEGVPPPSTLRVLQKHSLPHSSHDAPSQSEGGDGVSRGHDAGGEKILA